METQDTITNPSPIETGAVKQVGNASCGVPFDIAQIGEHL